MSDILIDEAESAWKQLISEVKKDLSSVKLYQRYYHDSQMQGGSFVQIRLTIGKDRAAFDKLQVEDGKTPCL
jgi:hypothetical protein